MKQKTFVITYFIFWMTLMLCGAFSSNPFPILIIAFLIFPIVGICLEHVFFDKEKKYTIFQKLLCIFLNEKAEWKYATKTEKLLIQYNKLTGIEKKEFLDKINNK